MPSLLDIQDQAEVNSGSINYDHCSSSSKQGRTHRGHKYNVKTMRGIFKAMNDTEDLPPLLAEAGSDSLIWHIFRGSPRSHL